MAVAASVVVTVVVTVAATVVAEGVAMAAAAVEVRAVVVRSARQNRWVPARAGSVVS